MGLEACFSGSFVNSLGHEGRTEGFVVTSGFVGKISVQRFGPKLLRFDEKINLTRASVCSPRQRQTGN